MTASVIDGAMLDNCINIQYSGNPLMDVKQSIRRFCANRTCAAAVVLFNGHNDTGVLDFTRNEYIATQGT